MSAARQEVLSGDLSDFGLSALIEAFSLGRSIMAVEIFSGSGDLVGRISIKAGRVLSATCGDLTGEAAVRELASRGGHGHFRVFRGPSLVTPMRPNTRAVPLPRGGAGRRPESVGRIPVMEGSLSEFDVASLMQVVSSGRQHTVIEVRNDRSEVTASLVVKANKVVSARAGSLTGIDAVTKTLELPAELDFAIYRLTTDVEGEPLGSVEDVLLRAASAGARSPGGVVRPGNDVSPDGDILVRSESELGALPTKPPPALPTTTVMEGSLSELDLASLLQVVSTSRQRTKIDVFDRSDCLVGSIETKAAWVLSATAGSERGETAIRRLLEEPPSSSFVICRIHEPILPSERGLGSLADLLLRACSLEAPEQGARTAPPSIPARSRVANKLRPSNVPSIRASTLTIRPQGQAVPPPPGGVSKGAGRRPESVGRIPVMEGSLSEFDIASLMQVVSSGRQHTVIEVRSDRSEVTATLVVKANKVVSARVGSLTGIDAVTKALELPAELDFAIYRLTTDVEGEPLGSVEDVLLRAASAGARSPSGGVRPGNDVSPDGGILRSCIMQGSVADADVPSLLQVLGSSRQFTELEVFRPDGSLAGKIHLKAGRMLHATAGSLTDVQAVRMLIDVHPDFRFRAWRRLSGADLPHGIGFIGDVLLRTINAEPVRSESDLGALPTKPPPTLPTTTVMEGSLSEIDLASLLQVVSTSRQRTKIDVFDRSDCLVGSIETKAAWVLSATAGSERGETAIRRLLEEPPSSSFVVSRIHEPILPSERGLGSLADLLLRACTAHESERVSAVRDRTEPGALASAPASVRSPVVTDEPSTSTSRVPEGPAAVEGADPVMQPRRNWRIPLAAVGLALASFGAGLAMRSSTRDVGLPPSPTPTVAASVAPLVPTSAPVPKTPSPPRATTADQAAVAVPSSTGPQASNGDGESRQAGEKAPREASEAYIRRVQTTLMENGYDPGKIDGTYGPMTAKAVRAFQRAEHLPDDGMLNESTRAALERARKRK